MKEEEAEGAQAILSEINEWYEEDGWTANLSTLESKFKTLSKNFTQIDRRQQIEKKRVIAIEKLEKELNKTYEEGKKIFEKKPYIEDHYNNNFLKDVNEVNTWFTESLEKQKELNLYDLTDFTSESIESKLFVLKRLINDLNRVQKSKESASTTDASKEEMKDNIKNADEAKFDATKEEGEEKKPEL